MGSELALILSSVAPQVRRDGGSGVFRDTGLTTNPGNAASGRPRSRLRCPPAESEPHADGGGHHRTTQLIG